MSDLQGISIGVIGCGNMASAIVKGIHRAYPTIHFKTYTPSHTKAIALAQEVRGEHVRELAQLASCEALLIGCKPQQFSQLEQELASSGLGHHYMISMLAAVSLERLARSLPDARFSRVMPNTPIKLGQGITLLLSAANVSRAENDLVKKLLTSCSLVQEVADEKQFDEVTVVSGSGPAYLFFFAHCLQLELQKYGLEERTASDMVAKLFMGTGQLMNDRGDLSFGQLLDQVTSKGGVTIEAIKVFQKDQMQEIISRALIKAVERSGEMSKAL